MKYFKIVGFEILVVSISWPEIIAHTTHMYTYLSMVTTDRLYTVKENSAL